MIQRLRPVEPDQLAARLVALDALPIVAFLADAEGSTFFHNRLWYELAGVSNAGELAEPWHRRVVPDERAGAAERFAAGVARGVPFVDEVRIKFAKDGSRPMLVSAQPLHDPATDEIVEWLGTLTLIDRPHYVDEARSMFVSLAENSGSFIAIAALDGNMVYVNEAGRKLLEVGTLEDARRTPSLDYFLPEDRSYVRDVIGATLQRDGKWSGDHRLRNQRSGEAVAVLLNVFYLRDPKTAEPIAVASVASDIRERIEAERRLRTLVEAGSSLSQSLDYAETLRNLADLLVRTVATFCVIDMFVEDEGRLKIERIVAVHAERKARAAIAHLAQFVPGPQDVAHPVVAAFIDGSSSLVAEVDNAWIDRVASSEEHAGVAKALGMRSLITVPLVANGRVLGALTCGLANEEKRTASKPHRYDAEDLFFIEELGRRGGAACENARSYERERRIAVSLQAASLPRTLPRYDSLRLSAEYRPGKTEATIGGDWYDAFALADGRIVLTVGDVLGNGLKAAITMTKLRQAMQAAAMIDPNPNVMLDVADKTLRMNDGESYATAIAAIFDPLAQTLSFASAGHPGPMLRTPDGRVEELGGSGILLGMRFGKDRRVNVHQIPPGSVLVFYTDGLTEVTRDIEAGQARLAAALAEVDVLGEINPAASLVEVVLRGEEASDDIAVLLAHTSLGTRAATGAQTTYSDASVSRRN